MGSPPGRVGAVGGRLWLALRLPGLALQALTTAADYPLVVSEERRGRQFVVARNRAAQRLGLHPGMSVNAARALHPALQVCERDPAREQRLLQRLGVWAGQFSAWVHLMPAAGGLLLEVAGSLHLFGGVQGIRQRALQSLQGLGYRAYGAVAPTPLAAWWLGQTSGNMAVITERTALEPALRLLPIAVMGLPPAQAETLRTLGVSTVGGCLDLPRKGLARRLNRALPLLLDQALGRAPDPRLPFQAPLRFEASQLLPAAIENSADLLLMLRRLVLELSGFLRGCGKGVEGFELLLCHHQPPPTRLAIGLCAPNRDPQHLLSLIRRRLERVVLQEPVIEVGLLASRLTDLASEARSLLAEPGAVEGDWQRLVEGLRARLGQRAVSGICLLPDHRPERAWGRCEPGERTTLVHAQTAFEPLWLLQRPEPLVRRDDGTGPWLGGPLTLEQGPRRIETGWWDGAEVRRDYYVARHAHGERYWVFKERGREARWFLHGLFA